MLLDGFHKKKKTGLDNVIGRISYESLLKILLDGFHKKKKIVIGKQSRSEFFIERLL